VTRPPRIAALALAAAFAAGCDRVAKRIVPAMTSERATWSYVDEAWGGMAVKTSAVNANQLSLTFRLFLHAPTRIDSGICIYAIAARADGRRVVVRLDRSLCGNTTGGYAVSLPKPEAGTYDVVYDDAAAGFPKLGRVTVP